MLLKPTTAPPLAHARATRTATQAFLSRVLVSSRRLRAASSRAADAARVRSLRLLAVAPGALGLRAPVRLPALLTATQLCAVHPLHGGGTQALPLLRLVSCGHAAQTRGGAGDGGGAAAPRCRTAGQRSRLEKARLAACEPACRRTTQCCHATECRRHGCHCEGPPRIAATDARGHAVALPTFVGGVTPLPCTHTHAAYAPPALAPRARDRVFASCVSCGAS